MMPDSGPRDGFSIIPLHQRYILIFYPRVKSRIFLSVVQKSTKQLAQ